MARKGQELPEKSWSSQLRLARDKAGSHSCGREAGRRRKYGCGPGHQLRHDPRSWKRKKQSSKGPRRQRRRKRRQEERG